MTLIAPSILAADFSNLEEQIRIAEDAGADWFHLDIMDGHFVPNISFGPMVVETVRKITDKPLDVHLMIENPDAYISQFVDAGANRISVHVETGYHLNRTVNLIKEKGARSGVVLNPATSISALENIINEIDLVLIMSVNPGFGGQSFIPHIIEKVKKTSDLIKHSSRDIYLEVDGGIDKKTAPDVVKAGATVLVAGSAIFGRKDIANSLAQIRKSLP